MTDPEERAINRAIVLLGDEHQDEREAARAALHTLFRDRRRLEADVTKYHRWFIDLRDGKGGWAEETMRLRSRIKELEARNELLERDRPLHCRGCDGHDIDLLGDPE